MKKIVTVLFSVLISVAAFAQNLPEFTEADNAYVFDAKQLKEDFGDGYDGYVLHAYIPGLGNKCTLIKSLDDAKKYISNAEYWDITKGSNASEPSNLIAWGGEGGYWYNAVNKPKWATGGTWKKLSDSQIQYILSKKQN